MTYRNLGRTGLKVSELCLGTMQFGWTADKQRSFEIMNAFEQAGGNFIDTADIYSSWAPDSPGGVSEEIIGDWMRERNNRRETIVATKVRGRMWDGPNGEGLNRNHIMQAAEDSLRRLKTDYIDLYQAHWADLSTPIEETMRAFDDLVKQGKVRYLGCSNYPAWRIAESLWVSDKQNLARFDCYQPEYSLVRREEFEREVMPLCRNYGIGVIPYSPLAGGFLTGKYRRDAKVESVRANDNLNAFGTEKNWELIDTLETIAKGAGKTITQVSLAWLLANPVVTAPIIGANTLDQLNDSLGASGFKLPTEQLKQLDELTLWPKGWRPIWD